MSDFNICGGFKHEEIVFGGRKCPLCETLGELESRTADIEYLNQQIARLEARNE